MLEKILKSLDLTADESKIYVGLLHGGATGAGELAKKLGMARPTLYDMLRKLRDKGIITQSMKYGVRSFHAEAPQKLDHLLRQKIADLQAQQKHLHGIMPMLEARRLKNAPPPRFQFFDGAEGVKNVIMDMLLYHDIPTYAFWSIKSALALLGADFFHDHNLERIRANIHVEAIWPRNQVVNIKRYPFLGGGKEFCRAIRVAPPDVEARMGYWIYGDKVAFLSSTNECYGFIVESAECVEMMVKQHQFIWKAATPLATNPEDVRGFLKRV
jgi:sugar-specific transcriptional regulator TrmB